MLLSVAHILSCPGVFCQAFFVMCYIKLQVLSLVARYVLHKITPVIACSAIEQCLEVAKNARNAFRIPEISFEKLQNCAKL